MDITSESKSDGHRHLSKARMMGKLFGREKKPSNNNSSNDAEVSAFLHGPSDKLYMNTSDAPPTLLRIDTSQASRWPTAAEVCRSRGTSRGRSTSPKRSKKGLVVRFTDSQPEIIGEGGDKADSPTLEISERKRSHSHPPNLKQALQGREPSDGVNNKSTTSSPNGIQPLPLRRAPTGHVAGPEVQSMSRLGLSNKDEGSGVIAPPPVAVEAEQFSSRSFAARVRAEMRAGEGRALKLGSLSAETTNGASPQDPTSQSSDSSPVPGVAIAGASSPHPVPWQLTPGLGLHDSTTQVRNKPNGERPQGMAGPVGTDILDEFSNRVQHFFKLFQLSAESVMPLGMCTVEALVRAASWWFLRGRASIENLARGRPSSSEGQQKYTISKQQAHADVAKCLWIIRDVITERADMKSLAGDDFKSSATPPKGEGDEYLLNMLERSQALTDSMRKLVISMQRHDCLPPPVDEAPLPQGLDPKIWIKYPPLTQDVLPLLSNNGNGAFRSPKALPRMTLPEAMPLGDTKQHFEYGRMFVGVLLIENGVESQTLLPSILFILRALNEKSLMITISSQHGLIALSVKSDHSSGPTWNDVSWQTRISAIDVNLSTGLVARIQFSTQDFKALWNMYDYTCKVHANLRPRRDEFIAFEQTLPTFQYFDRDPLSRAFPKEPLTRCEMRIFEKRTTVPRGIGVGSIYYGFRIATVTGSHTKNLSGISHDVLTGMPLQYGFMRGEGGSPALLLKIEDGLKQPTMVLTFENTHNRSELHSCVTGGVFGTDLVVAHVQIKNHVITEPPQTEYQPSHNDLHDLEWQSVQVVTKAISNSPGATVNSTRFSDELRLILDAKSVIISDRIGFNPGNLKIRLSTQLTRNEIAIFREPQHDMSISVSESQVSKETPQDISGLLAVVAKSQTIRKYTFPKLEDLHKFQEAITGFNVLFDGLSEAYSISRRRSVVSISKKWEASLCRLQVLSHETTIQLAVFFNTFVHGECMNFVLKPTDTFETFSKGGKHSVRVTDAKFALPKVREEGQQGSDEGFICLAAPEYPSEHDDITITFGSEIERDKFAKALPAPAKAISKLSTVMSSKSHDDNESLFTSAMDLAENSVKRGSSGSQASRLKNSELNDRSKYRFDPVTQVFKIDDVQVDALLPANLLGIMLILTEKSIIDKFNFEDQKRALVEFGLVINSRARVRLNRGTRFGRPLVYKGAALLAAYSNDE